MASYGCENNKTMNVNNDHFEEYLKDKEPDRAKKVYAWNTAIGLQAVDGIKPSHDLIDTALKNINGEITITEAEKLIDAYYEARSPYIVDHDRREEADKVSLRIVKLLYKEDFSLTVDAYLEMHRQLFHGLYKHAGIIRDYNITKREWVLDGDSVLYGEASILRSVLESTFKKENAFSNQGLTIDEMIHHIALFYPKYGKYISLEKETRERQLYSLSSI